MVEALGKEEVEEGLEEEELPPKEKGAVEVALPPKEKAEEVSLFLFFGFTFARPPDESLEARRAGLATGEA